MLMIAERMAGQAEIQNTRENSIAAIVFCAFSLEGYLNHVGEELFPNWNEMFESLSPKAKLALLADRHGLRPSFGSPPFQSFGTIFEVRNQLAHPKTKKHNFQEMKGKVWLEVGAMKWPVQKWESLCEARYAEQFVADTKEMIRFLNSAFPIERVPDFVLSENV